MLLSFVHSFQAEWLKRKRSAASWLVIIGGFFIPLIMLLAQIFYTEKFPTDSPTFWENLINQSWQPMALFLLPLGIILTTSLITQLEHKNNTFKQVFAAPIGFGTIFFSKLTMIFLMLIQLFVLFDLGVILSGIIPALILPSVDFPTESIPVLYLLKMNVSFFVACLPIVGLQYILGIRFRNFMVPLGIGLGLFIVSMFGLNWEYNYVIPYAYSSLTFLVALNSNFSQPPVSISVLSTICFTVILIAGYLLYFARKERG